MASKFGTKGILRPTYIFLYTFLTYFNNLVFAHIKSNTIFALELIKQMESNLLNGILAAIVGISMLGAITSGVRYEKTIKQQNDSLFSDTTKINLVIQK